MFIFPASWYQSIAAWDVAIPHRLRYILKCKLFFTGSRAHKKVLEIAMNKRLLKDMRQIAPGSETYSLESFHSVLNGFAPKAVCISPEGMRTRKVNDNLH